MAKKNGSLKLKIAACKKCKSQPRLKLGLSFYFECNCGQSISGAYGDVVLVPFVGSGTSCRVANRYGRQYIGD